MMIYLIIFFLVKGDVKELKAALRKTSKAAIDKKDEWYAYTNLLTF